ncbi:DUF4340 domain-containing protein [Sulfurivermis fontis]|jgi:hypothetical protein|uniref:DUF4340 domain-containing protein n=1 Tax=Sulfurivermis fontis TaxID=1972068 RepID=UPI000FDB42D2|nr:DUF4340 domain-containing protein [Sulfurivermis fontis]
MQKTLKLLAVLLGAQLLLALGLNLADRGVSAPAESGPLLAIAKEKIDRITLEGPDQARVVLAKKDGAWRLTEAGDFPADGDRVEQLIERLAGLRTTTPVATSASAQARFKVSGDAFERRVTLAQGDKALATLYIGTSPSMRLVHARVDGQDAIHTVALATYDLPVKAADWEDKKLLAVSQDDVTTIELAGLTLRRQSAAHSDGGEGAATPGWSAEPMDAGKRLNAEAVDKLLDQLAGLRFAHVLGREAQPDFGLAAPALSLKLSRKTGEVLEYRLSKAPDKEEYTLKASTRPEYFRLDSWNAKALLDAAKRDALVQDAPAKTDAAAAAPAKP